MAALISVAAGSDAQPAAAPVQSDPGALLVARLALMPAVAADKWANGLPVEDLAREARVLELAEESGLRWNLRTDSVRQLFQVQIAAAKEIQNYWFGRWRQGERVPQAPDLAGELRPRIVSLGNAILAAAAADPGTLPQLPPVAGLSPQTAQALAQAYAALSPYPDRLTQILESRVLRVGTTGDYAPFSLLQEGQQYTGIDIDLAADLAQSLGVELRLVATSWPDLLPDLRAGAFDIAMSGVSRTLDRQAYGYFSIPYYAGGKTAISRCEDVDRFSSLEAIDQPGVRVIVNPGGTNERFAAANIHRASTIVHPDNRTIFAEIAADRADVMFTDAIEVELQAARSEVLCRAIAGTLTYQEKGYLLPQSVALVRYVDLWLGQRLADGTVARLFAVQGVRQSL